MRRLSLIAAVLALSACAAPRYPPAPPLEAPQPASPRMRIPPSPPSTENGLIPLAELPGWHAEDHAAALRAFAAGCGVARDPDLVAVCREAQALGPTGETTARVFLERRFRARLVGDGGVLTAYFAPEYEARESRDPPFVAAVRPPPTAVESMTSLGDRAAIEASDPEQALAWMRPEDLFFMQIQGSGMLDLPYGRRLRARFAGTNGQPFVAIARILRARGDLPAAGAGGEAIRSWLADHRGPEADSIMEMDPRYVFFNVVPDDGREPSGTAGIPLIAGRSIAVDASQHALGGVYWIDAGAPVLTGAPSLYRQLVIALDTGGAIKGPVRADLYLGRGAAAGDEAGRVRHSLRLYALVPSEP